MTATQRFTQQITAALHTAAATTTGTIAAALLHDGLARWASQAADAALSAVVADPSTLPHERDIVAREIEWRAIDRQREQYEAQLAMGRVWGEA